MGVVKVYETVNIETINKPKYKKPVFKTKTLEDYKTQVSNVLNKLGGKYIKFDDIDHTEGLIIGGVINNSIIDDISDKDKVCFAVMNRDKKLVYINNNEHFSILQNIPSSLYVLDYLYKHEPNTLRDYAEVSLNNDNVELFTNIYINVPKKQHKSKNKKR